MLCYDNTDQDNIDETHVWYAAADGRLVALSKRACCSTNVPAQIRPAALRSVQGKVLLSVAIPKAAMVGMS